MAAKDYLRIEQENDFYSLTQLSPDVSLDLEPEEDALARTLFQGYDCFDFDEPGPQLRKAIKTFKCALMNSRYCILDSRLDRFRARNSVRPLSWQLC